MVWSKFKNYSIFLISILIVISSLTAGPQARIGRSQFRNPLVREFFNQPFFNNAFEQNVRRSKFFQGDNLKQADTLLHGFMRANRSVFHNLVAEDKQIFKVVVAEIYNPPIRGLAKRSRLTLSEDLSHDVHVGFFSGINGFLENRTEGAIYNPDKGSPLGYAIGILKNKEKGYFIGLSHKIPPISEVCPGVEDPELITEADKIDYQNYKNSRFSSFNVDLSDAITIAKAGIKAIEPDPKKNFYYQTIFDGKKPGEIAKENDLKVQAVKDKKTSQKKQFLNSQIGRTLGIDWGRIDRGREMFPRKKKN